MSRSVNLVPAATLRRQAISRLSRVWTVALLTTGSIAGLLVGVEWARGLAALDEMKRLDAAYVPLVGVVQGREALRQQIERLRSREQTALRLANEHHAVSALAAVTLASAATEGGVYLDAIAYRAPGAHSAASHADRPTVRLTGAGVNSVAVAQFAENLRTGGGLAAVTVESTSALPGGDPGHRRFEILCHL